MNKTNFELNNKTPNYTGNYTEIDDTDEEICAITQKIGQTILVEPEDSTRPSTPFSVISESTFSNLSQSPERQFLSPLNTSQTASPLLANTSPLSDTEENFQRLEIFLEECAAGVRDGIFFERPDLELLSEKMTPIALQTTSEVFADQLDDELPNLYLNDKIKWISNARILPKDTLINMLQKNCIRIKTQIEEDGNGSVDSFSYFLDQLFKTFLIDYVFAKGTHELVTLCRHVCLIEANDIEDKFHEIDLLINDIWTERRQQNGLTVSMISFDRPLLNH